MKKAPKTNPACPFCSSHPTIKIGLKKNKLRTSQRFLCKTCKRTFISQPSLQKHKTYSLQTILNAISNYNLNTPLRNQPVPKSTIHNWIKSINLPFNRLRGKIKNTLVDEIIIKTQFIHHQQPFLYQYHSLKLDFAKKFPTLISYLKEINKTLPKDIFNNSERISQISKMRSKETPTTMARRGRGCSLRDAEQGFFKEKTDEAIDVVGVSKTNQDINLATKNNYAVKLADIASQITNDNKQRHNIIESFMLVNDTATIATEIPVYLREDETEIKKALTGHIDILQIRYHKIYLLDYKPEPTTKQQAIQQLLLYREAISKRTSIPTYKFKLAFFNNKEYCEID